MTEKPNNFTDRAWFEFQNYQKTYKEALKENNEEICPSCGHRLTEQADYITETIRKHQVAKKEHGQGICNPETCALCKHAPGIPRGIR